MSVFKTKAKRIEVLIVSIFIIFIFSLTFYKISEGVILAPSEKPEHTTIVYYDGGFSEQSLNQGTDTSLYIINESQEEINVSISEYEPGKKTEKTYVTIPPTEAQFIKMEKNGVIYLDSADKKKRSVIKFSKYLNGYNFF